jgi:hypothetical protein
MAMKAEEFIAWQHTNGLSIDVDEFPMTDVKLVKLSPDMLRTMVGEFGDQGLKRYFPGEYLVNPDLIRPYTEITDLMLERFGEGWLAAPGSIADTDLANVGRQMTLQVRRVAPRQYVERTTRTASSWRHAGRHRCAALHQVQEEGPKNRIEDILAVALDLILPSGTRSPSMISHPDRSTRRAEDLAGTTADRDPGCAFDQEATPRCVRGAEDQGALTGPVALLTFNSLDDDRDLEHQPARRRGAGPPGVVLPAGRPVRPGTDRAPKRPQAHRPGVTIVLGPGRRTPPHASTWSSC